MDREPSSPSLLKFLGQAALVVVPLVYLVIALNTGDILWALPVFNARPQAIVVHCFGEDVSLEPGSEDFAEITKIVNSALSGRKRWDSLTLSQASYQDYLKHQKMMSVEILYGEPVRVHSPYKFFSTADSFVIPLVGRHAETNAIFGRRSDLSTAGSLHVVTTAPLVEYLEARGICNRP